jgi:hypothetical protein
LDDDMKFDRRAPLLGEPDRSLSYQSVNLMGSTANEIGPADMPYVLGGIEGVVTEEHPIREFRYLLANGGGEFRYVHQSRTRFEVVLAGSFVETVSSERNICINTGDLLLSRSSIGTGFDRRFRGGADDCFLSLVATSD